MKRQWKLNRIILALTLLGIAGLVFAYWPRSACCQLPAGEIVGFDEAKKLIYTTTMRDKVQMLECYDVNSGALISRYKVPFPAMKGISPGIEWPCILSRGKQFLIGISMWSDVVRISRLSTIAEQPTRNDLTFSIPSCSYPYGLSQDGKSLILLKDGEGDSDIFVVCDLETGIQIETLPIAHIPTGNGGFSMNITPPELIQLSADRRYLAATLTSALSQLNSRVG